MPKLLFPFLLISVFMVALAPADAQFVTIARKVKSMRTGNTNIAHVIIDAGTTNVYKTIIDSLRPIQKLTLP